MLTIERSLNIYAAGIPQIIRLSQYDDDFRLVFSLYTSEGEFTIPSGTTAEVMGTKVDGNGYSASASISGSTVTVTGNKQMTACAGRNVYEIVLTQSGKRLATVNFILKVERAALDADTIQSETVLKELNAIIDSAATATEAAETATAAAESAAESARTMTIDPTLTQSGQAADAGAVGDEISGLKEDLSELEEQIESISLSEQVKVALLNCFQNVGWKNKESRETYYNALYNALYPEADVVSISATYNQGSDIVYTDDPLDNLKAYLTVIATYSTGRTKRITDYALIGTLAEGTNTITVTYARKTTTFTMTAVDFYNIWEWDSRFTGVGQLTRIGAKCTDFTYDGESARGVLYYDGDVSANKSRGFATLRGKAPMVLNTDRTKTADFYPIPIPATAGKITATVTPNTQRLALYLFRYDPANQTIAPYKRFSTISWNVGSQTITFTPESNLFFCFNCSVDASFPPYTVEPEMNVVFE